MKYFEECSLEDFDAWGGGEDTLNFLRRHDMCEQVEEIIGQCMPHADETAVNDFLWFEADFIAENLGYKDWDDMENRLE